MMLREEFIQIMKIWLIWFCELWKVVYTLIVLKYPYVFSKHKPPFFNEKNFPENIGKP